MVSICRARSRGQSAGVVPRPVPHAESRLTQAKGRIPWVNPGELARMCITTSLRSSRSRAGFHGGRIRVTLRVDSGRPGRSGRPTSTANEGTCWIDRMNASEPRYCRGRHLHPVCQWPTAAGYGLLRQPWTTTANDKTSPNTPNKVTDGWMLLLCSRQAW